MPRRPERCSHSDAWLFSPASTKPAANPAAKLAAKPAPAPAPVAKLAPAEQPLQPSVRAAEISADIAPPSPSAEVGTEGAEEEACELTAVATKVTIAEDWKAAMAYLRSDAFGGD